MLVSRVKMQLMAIVNNEPPDRLRALEMALFSGVELLLIVAYAIAVGAPMLLLSLVAGAGYRTGAIVCVLRVDWSVDENVLFSTRSSMSRMQWWKIEQPIRVSHLSRRVA